MAILVDCSPLFDKGRSWFFMTSDKSIDELIIFSRKIGLKREWLKTEGGLPRFMISSFFRKRAISMGAKEASAKQLLAASEAIGKHEEEA